MAEEAGLADAGACVEIPPPPPPFPSARADGYLFGVTAALGLDVLGESQLIGYPSIPFTRGPPISGPWTAPPQYPSVSLLSWGGAFGQQGDGTARYWVLKLLVDEFRAGPPAGSFAPADADMLVATSTTGGSGPLASPFCASVLNLQNLSIFCASGVINAVQFASYGTPAGSCGSWTVNSSCNAANSAAVVEAACVGKAACTVMAGPPNFGDPCFDTVKHLDVQATCSSGGGAQATGSPVYAQAYVEAGSARKILVVNTDAVPHRVSFAGAKGAAWQYIDESTGFGPAVTTTLDADEWTLDGYALGLLRL